MKTTVSLLTGLMLFIFASCKKEYKANNENFIPVNKCQAFNSNETIITCCLDSVLQDSRCPINAVCIWQGIAVARFKVNVQTSHHIITLATSKFQPYNNDSTVAGFKIEFINLLPQIELNKSINYNDYIAQIKLTKL